ncbi:MAG: Druantia anti-phage system protein DruA [Pseudomonadota bacterium]
MDMQNLKSSITIRNRNITNSDLITIRETIVANWGLGRSAISHVLCEQWDWRQANGQLKGMACRELLLRLERLGYITLPARLNEKNNTIKLEALPDRYQLCHVEPITGRVDSFTNLRFELIHDKKQGELWNSLVANYHYLGHKHIVGHCLKYIVHLDEQLVSCIAWGSSAWKVACRDQFIGWSASQRKKNLSGIVNNVRFLIFPWIKVKHLASKILALCCRRLPLDWKQKFNETPVLAETFVDATKFQGTSYKAANWCYIGNTSGSGKKGISYHYHGIIKSVFVYPLAVDFKKRLCQ